jgi:GGDEF domain-containing protein
MPSYVWGGEGVRLSRYIIEALCQASGVYETVPLPGLCCASQRSQEVPADHKRKSLRWLAESTRQKSIFALLTINIDNFKRFNDPNARHGDDTIARAVSEVLFSTFQDMELIVNWCRDEFSGMLAATYLPLSAACLLIGLVLVREVRLRRALQRLLIKRNKIKQWLGRARRSFRQAKIRDELNGLASMEPISGARKQRDSDSLGPASEP